MKKIISLINLYLTYANKPDIYEKNYQKPFISIREEIKIGLQEIQLNQLIELYIDYTSVHYFQKNSKIDDILSLIFDVIISKLNTVSIMKLIDLYTIIFNRTLSAGEDLDSNNNIISSRTRKLNSESFVQDETKKNKHKLEEYRNELIFYKENVQNYEKRYELLDRLQKDILIYIETSSFNMTDQEIEFILETLNSRIESTSEEILKRNALRGNHKAIDLQSRFSGRPIFEIRENLETVGLKNNNEVYISLRADFEEKKKNIKK